MLYNTDSLISRNSIYGGLEYQHTVSKINLAKTAGRISLLNGDTWFSPCRVQFPQSGPASSNLKKIHLKSDSSSLAGIYWSCVKLHIAPNIKYQWAQLKDRVLYLKNKCDVQSLRAPKKVTLSCIFQSSLDIILLQQEQKKKKADR